MREKTKGALCLIGIATTLLTTSCVINQSLNFTKQTPTRSSNMQTAIYTVYDKKAEAFMQPFFSKNDATAIRDFETACRTQEHIFQQHPEDYMLFNIGHFDDATANIEPKPPTAIASAMDFATVGSSAINLAQ